MRAETIEIDKALLRFSAALDRPLPCGRDEFVLMASQARRDLIDGLSGPEEALVLLEASGLDPSCGSGPKSS